MPVAIRVILHGYLSKITGPIELAAPTVAHALEQLTRLFPALRSNGSRGRHRVVVAGYKHEHDFYAPIKNREVHIFPQFSGAKNAPLTQILVGGLLIAAAFATAGTSLAFLGPALFSMGGAFVAGGLVQILAPKPKEEEKSKYLGAPKNTVAIGTRIPVLYGRYRVYGHYLSFEIFSTLQPANR